jgi:cell division protein FtsQ
MRTKTRPAQAEPTAADERTVRIARRRFARRQRARRWLAWRRLLIVALVVGVVAGVVWLFYFSSLLAVQAVRVEGSRGAEQNAVRRAAAVPLGGPLVSADLGAIRARVERLSFVKAADVSRAWPDAVRVGVTPRTPVAVVDRGGTFSALDESGVLFRRFTVRPTTLPLIHMQTGTKSAALAEGAKVAASLPHSLARRVDFVDVRTVDQITLHLRNGRTVLWGSSDSSSDKARVLVVLLHQKATYYDVSVPGQPVIRPLGP